MSALAGGINAGASAATMVNGAITSVMNTINEIHHGWNQVLLKKQDMAAQIPGLVTIPPVIGCR